MDMSAGNPFVGGAQNRNNNGGSSLELISLLRQSPFSPLFDIPGIDSPEDIFGNVGVPGGNPFAGSNVGIPSSNPFVGSNVPVRNHSFSSSPLAGENFWTVFAKGMNADRNNPPIDVNNLVDSISLFARTNPGSGKNPFVDFGDRLHSSIFDRLFDRLSTVLDDNLTFNEVVNPFANGFNAPVGNGNRDFGNNNFTLGNGNWDFGDGNITIGNGTWNFGRGNATIGNGNWYWDFTTDNVTLGNGNWHWDFTNGNTTLGNGNWFFGNNNATVGNGNWDFGNNNTIVGNGNWVFTSNNTIVGNGNWLISNQPRQILASVPEFSSTIALMGVGFFCLLWSQFKKHRWQNLLCINSNFVTLSTNKAKSVLTFKSNYSCRSSN